jgi:transposase-like protein
LINLTALLHDADAGATVATLAAQHGLSASRVYRILREYRPVRARSPRPRTSKVPAKIQALAAAGCDVARVAELLDVSKAYVYRWWPKENDGRNS